MDCVDAQKLIPQAEYAKRLRSLLPDEAFLPDPGKLVILLINLVILILGWVIASHLDRWPLHLVWLYLPLALVMGNSVIVLAFSCHDLMHGSVVKNSMIVRIITLLGTAILWMPPTLWKVVHNRVHHNHTNSLADPDRSYLYDQPKTWGKWIQNLLAPSTEVNPIFLAIGMVTMWGLYSCRNLILVLLFNQESVNSVPAVFVVNTKERWAIIRELFVMLIIHLAILLYLHFEPLKLAFSYFLPIGIGYGGIIFYIYTHHMICQMTKVNDPLVNSLSIQVTQLFDILHLNFSYHTEHHIFPGMNSDYYPKVQELLKTYYPERFNLLSAEDAWRLLMQTPRHYKNENTFTDWFGEKSVRCPLEQMGIDAKT